LLNTGTTFVRQGRLCTSFRLLCLALLSHQTLNGLVSSSFCTQSFFTHRLGNLFCFFRNSFFFLYILELCIIFFLSFIAIQELYSCFFATSSLYAKHTTNIKRFWLSLQQTHTRVISRKHQARLKHLQKPITFFFVWLSLSFWC